MPRPSKPYALRPLAEALKDAMPVRNDRKVDSWVVGDQDGVLHAAQVHRFYNESGDLRLVYIATACAPQIVQRRHERTDLTWHGSDLPEIALANGVVVTRYRVRDAVTCLQCHAMAVTL